MLTTASVLRGQDEYILPMKTSRDTRDDTPLTYRDAGVDIGARHDPMGVAFLNGPNEGHDVFVPIDAIIGGQAMAGQGWRMLMDCLSAGRSISLPSQSCGASQLVLR